MSRFPPNLLWWTAGVTPAAAGVTLSAPAIASPGAGFRLRLWSSTMAFTIPDQAPTKTRFGWRHAPAATVVSWQSAQGFDSKEQNWPGGLALPENTGLDAWMNAAVVPSGVTFYIYYTVERVA